MSKEVMKLALSTLEGWANYDDWVWPESALEQSKRNTIEAITALRQALGTEQQPVAWTAKAFARLGEVRDKMRPDDVRIVQQFLDGDYTALEQTLEEKQEPVAWANSSDLQNFDMRVRTGPDLHHTVPLYTAPPKREYVTEVVAVHENGTRTVKRTPIQKREWVGLTDEEHDSIKDNYHNMTWTLEMFGRAIEAKLKEKNT